MDIISGTTNKMIRHDIDYQIIKITDDIFAFKYTNTISEKGSQNTGGMTQGITNKADIHNLIMYGDKPKDTHYVFSDNHLTKAKKYGIYHARFVSGYAPILVFDYISSGGSINNVIRHSARFLYDIQGNIIPCGILFDYIDAQMSNEHYNLSTAIDILTKRNDITFIDRYADDDVPEVLCIPDYNSTDDCDRYISFIWTPIAEQAIKLTNLTSSEMYKLIFDEDMLELRAGGAAKFETFYT